MGLFSRNEQPAALQQVTNDDLVGEVRYRAKVNAIASAANRGDEGSVRNIAESMTNEELQRLKAQLEN